MVGSLIFLLTVIINIFIYVFIVTNLYRVEIFSSLAIFYICK